MDKYQFIKNPLTNRKVLVYSKLGKKIIKNYMIQQKGSGYCYSSMSPLWNTGWTVGDKFKYKVNRRKLSFDSSNTAGLTRLDITDFFNNSEHKVYSKSINSPLLLSMIIGSDNSDKRFRGWDIALNNINTGSNVRLADPMLIQGDFNEYNRDISYLFEGLKNRFELIAFDMSTVKFLHNYDIVKGILKHALTINGKLFLPIKTGGQQGLVTQTLADRTILESQGYIFNDHKRDYTVNSAKLINIQNYWKNRGEYPFALPHQQFIFTGGSPPPYSPNLDFFIDTMTTQLQELVNEINTSEREHIIINNQNKPKYPFKNTQWAQEPYIVIERIL